MNFSRFVLIAVFATLLAAPALAQTDVQISADTFTIEEGTKEAVFVGNVVIKHPTVNVWADKVVATYGDGGTSDIKSFEATGKVKLEDGRADGNRRSRRVLARRSIAAPDRQCRGQQCRRQRQRAGTGG
ncbi:LptA/OstA family protein [Devosia riboflavina]